MTESSFNLPAPAGFVSFDPEKPMSIYHRRLPHWRQDGATYFVTFRQSDSLPKSVIRALERERREWEARNPEPRTQDQWDELARQTFHRIETALDQGTGSCLLRLTRAQTVVSNALRFFDGERYELGAFIVMPNHVHLLVKPIEPHRWSLEKILHSWKRHTATELNRLSGGEGRFWQEESFDRIVRDVEHLFRCIQYIGNNGDKAGLRESQFRLWIREDWAHAGWGFQRTLARRHRGARVENPCYIDGGAVL